jgi:hypothetical protein
VVGWVAVASAALAAAIAVLVIIAGFVSGADIRSAGDCESEDHPEACTTELQVGVIGSALLGVAGWGVAAGWGMLQGRGWARWSVMITHSLWAIAVAGYFWSLATTPEGLDASGVVAGFVVTGTFLAIVASAASLPRAG